MRFFKTVLAVMVGFLVTYLFILGITVILLVSFANSGDVVTKDNTILVLKINSNITERKQSDFLGLTQLFDSENRNLSLQEILNYIKIAENDSKVKGILLEPGMDMPGLATLSEIRTALENFKKSKKFIYSYSEIYTQKAYYLSSIADSIYLNTNGVFNFSGLHTEQLFLKGMFDKLDIQPILIRAGKYKSAGEMFINDSMSQANRQQITEYMQSVYDNTLNSIARSRKIGIDELKDICYNYKAKFPNQAVQYKLVDKAIYEDQLYTTLRKVTNTEAKKDLNLMSFQTYSEVDHTLPYSSSGEIAVVYAVGEIGGGKGDENSIGSELMAKTISKAAKDDKIKAIILRINSPGGGALASDIIWREVLLAKAKKPVIASFGDVAASGGYYIAAPATRIFAQSNTVTGSIGVFGFLPNLSKFWPNKLGIRWDRVKIGKYSDIGNPNRPMTADELALIQSYVDTTYEQFKQRVANGRKLSMDQVQSLAQGRIYSGTQALDIGLVDEIGTLDQAIAYTAKLVKLEKYKIRNLPVIDEKLPGALGKMFNAKVETEMQSKLGNQYLMWQQMSAMTRQQGLLMLMPFQLNID